MTEAEALLNGLTQTWVSTGTKKQNALAFDLVEGLRAKGVTAHVIPVESKIGTFNAIWRDREFEKRLKVEKY
jgi:hypothetical protein